VCGDQGDHQIDGLKEEEKKNRPFFAGSILLRRDENINRAGPGEGVKRIERNPRRTRGPGGPYGTGKIRTVQTDPDQSRSTIRVVSSPATRSGS
jgi:hypothetical protein